jgi:uncharacterized protein
MFDTAKRVARHRLLRNGAIIALVVPAALLVACGGQEQPAPPPQPVAVQAPPPAPAPPPPAPVVGERD